MTGGQGNGLLLVVGTAENLTEVLLVVLDQGRELVQIGDLIKVQHLVKDDLEAAAGGLNHDPPHASKLVHPTCTEKLFDASPPPQGSDGERSREVTHV